ncbi:MAG: rRNA-processing protein and EBNA1-binding protein ebp2 [Thelocarpon impressellum]|nr:MAG: rRNA-processing protein and EBNA1-binding protein ebp2 [Thelocarpon impressellum]
MAKGKLKAALVAHQGKDVRKEHQKKVMKQAVRKKKGKTELQDADEGDKEEGGVVLDAVENESEESVDGRVVIDTSRIDDSDSDSDSDEEDEAGGEDDDAMGALLQELQADDDLELVDEEVDDEAEDDDIPLSDLDSLDDDEKGDVLPHQRLTINNTSALRRALASIALPISSLPFSEHQSLTSAAPTTIADVDDDLNRELAFYAQSLEAVRMARGLLRREKAPFTRPADYFAEMVKSDEHMGKIKQKLVDEAAGKRAAADARRQRDLKKFGKQVQVAKLQERDKQKREMLEGVKALKRKRQSAPLTTAPDEETLFDVAVEEATSRPSKPSGRQEGRPGKRQKRDEKHGFGGKKRFAKSGDAASSADLSGFSVKGMKARGGPGGRGGARGGGSRGGGTRGGAKGGSKRLGKSRRANT